MKNNLLSENLTYIGHSQTQTHIHLCTYNIDGMSEIESDDFSIIVDALKKDQTNWIQVHGLNNTNVIKQICSHFDINFLSQQDILNIKHPTKVEEFDNYIFIITKLFKLLKNESEENEELLQQQVSIILGHNYVITFMERESEFFNDIKTAIDNNILKIRERKTDYLFSVIMNSIIGNYRNIISTIEDKLDDLEDRLLSISDVQDIGTSIQTFRRQHMVIKKAISPLKDQIAKLFLSDNKFINKKNIAFFNDVNDHLQYVIQSIEICRETLYSLVDLYISNNDLRMNKIMKHLTIVSTIFIPLTFLVGIWGMNFKFMPELEWKYGYLFAWSIMIVTAIFTHLYFKIKKY